MKMRIKRKQFWWTWHLLPVQYWPGGHKEMGIARIVRNVCKPKEKNYE